MQVSDQTLLVFVEHFRVQKVINVVSQNAIALPDSFLKLAIEVPESVLGAHIKFFSASPVRLVVFPLANIRNFTGQSSL